MNRDWECVLVSPAAVGNPNALSVYTACRKGGGDPVRCYVDQQGLLGMFLARCRGVAASGPARAPRNGKWLHGDFRQLYEMKIDEGSGHRILGFRHGAGMYLVHAVQKTKDRKQAKDYQRALDLRAAFLNDDP